MEEHRMPIQETFWKLIKLLKRAHRAFRRKFFRLSKSETVNIILSAGLEVIFYGMCGWVAITPGMIFLAVIIK